MAGLCPGHLKYGNNSQIEAEARLDIILALRPPKLLSKASYFCEQLTDLPNSRSGKHYLSSPLNCRHYSTNLLWSRVEFCLFDQLQSRPFKTFI